MAGYLNEKDQFSETTTICWQNISTKRNVNTSWGIKRQEKILSE